MTKFIIYNKANKTYFGQGIVNGVKKMGFYKDPKDDVLMFDELQSANFVVQLLYDIRGYKSLEVTEIQV